MDDATRFKKLQTYFNQIFAANYDVRLDGSAGNIISRDAVKAYTSSDLTKYPLSKVSKLMVIK